VLSGDRRSPVTDPEWPRWGGQSVPRLRDRPKAGAGSWETSRGAPLYSTRAGARSAVAAVANAAQRPPVHPRQDPDW